MKTIILIFLTLVFASCGKNVNHKGPTANSSRGCLDLSSDPSCVSSDQDSEAVELLESMVESTIRVDPDSISFDQDKDSTIVGRKISCNLSLRKDQRYGYALQGDDLYLTTNEGNFLYKRISAGDGVNGTWTWSGVRENSALVFMTLSIVGSTKFILRSHCES